MKAMKLVSAVALVLVTVACGQQQQGSTVKDDSSNDAASAFDPLSSPIYLPRSMAGAFALSHRSSKSVVFEMDFSPGSSKAANVSYGIGSGTVSANQTTTTATPQNCSSKMTAGWTCTYNEVSGLFSVTIKLVDPDNAVFAIDSLTDTNGNTRTSGFNSQMITDGTSGSVSCDAGVGLCDFGNF